MIESKDQLTDKFSRLSGEFVETGSAMTGIDLDDAVIALKRYALSVMKNEELGQLLGQFRDPVRACDRESVKALTEQVLKSL